MMKKYLMTGMAAIALCAAFTSCSKGDEVYDPARNQTADVVKATYQDAFIKTIGKPAANQDWGFGTVAGTRTAYPNGNMWEQEGWNVPPVITDAQKEIVRQYFQQNTPIGYNDPQWSNYWIQQVYKGGTKAKGSGDDNSQTTETYTIGNDDAVVGGDHMDHLCSKAENGTEDHINDFNNSDNNDWEGRMLMTNSSTYSFGYINSNATAIHYDKAALVNWRVIAQWAVDNGLESSVESSVLNDGWNRSYMGFDWEQALPDDCYSRNVVTEGGWTSPENYEEGATYINGFKVKSITYNTFEFEGETYRFLSSNANQYAYDESEPTFGGKQNYNDRPSDDIIRQLLSLGYLPYSDTLKDWIKLSTGADGYYSDWIVTLTEAEKDDTPTPQYRVRVIGEDLSAGEEAHDFDFNDVVFDVAFNIQGKTYIRLKAAGGTLPLIIGVANPADDQDYTENEVHHLFGNYSTKTMINTHYTGIYDSADGVPDAILELNQEYTNAKFIPVYVKKNGTWVELTAERGEPASKIGVEIDFQWVDERVYIGDEYPRFIKWVTENTDDVSIWY